MVSAVVLTNLLLASTALAAPSLEAALNHHAAGHHSNTTQNIEGSVNIVRDVMPDNNRAGAMYNGAPATFILVSGVFTIPTINPPAFSGSVDISVGIDVDTCTSATFRTGIKLAMNEGQVLYVAWGEWYPSATQYLLDSNGKAIDFSPGHVIKLSISISESSPNIGTAYIQNLSTGKFVYQDFQTSNPLCQRGAAWIIEAMPGSQFDFSNFGTVVFTSAVAGTHEVKNIGPGGAYIIDMVRNNHVVTSTHVGISSVTINYI